jgi:hypothetical protein
VFLWHVCFASAVLPLAAIGGYPEEDLRPVLAVPPQAPSDLVLASANFEGGLRLGAYLVGDTRREAYSLCQQAALAGVQHLAVAAPDAVAQHGLLSASCPPEGLALPPTLASSGADGLELVLQLLQLTPVAAQLPSSAHRAYEDYWAWAEARVLFGLGIG